MRPGPAIPRLGEVGEHERFQQVLETRGKRALYSTSFLAVDALVERSGADRLIDCFELLVANGGSAESFRRSFGMDIDQFDREFAATLPALPPASSRPR